MFRGHLLKFVMLSTLLVAGCSSLPGLQVLTGQATPQNNAAPGTVQALDLVMADKTGSTDPGLSAAADRIEAADGSVNIIEVRKDLSSRVLTVNMLFSPPQTDTSTLQGQIDQLDALRMAIEVTWQGMMNVSVGTDQFDIRLLYPQTISTLDHGQSFIGQIIAEATIDRSAAASYLAGSRNLNNFLTMVINGTLNYQQPSQFELYQGTPNHPMFMLPASSASASASSTDSSSSSGSTSTSGQSTGGT